MATLTIRNIPDFVHRRLKHQAERHNRSLNGEVVELLERTVIGSSPEQSEVLLEELKREQNRTPAWKVADEEMKRMMREGLA